MQDTKNVSSTVDDNVSMSASQVIENGNHYHSSITQASESATPNIADNEDDEFGGGCFDVAVYHTQMVTEVAKDISGTGVTTGCVKAKISAASSSDEDEGENEDEDEDEETIPDDIGCFPNLNKDIPVNSTDEDDEFGGGSFDVTTYQANQAVSAGAIGNTVDDEHDEFDGGSFNVGKYRTDKNEVTSSKDEIAFSLDFPLLAAKGLKSNQYLIDELVDYCEIGKSITIPLVIDTEFYTKYEIDSLGYRQETRKLLTTQIKGIHKKAEKLIYAPHPSVNLGRELAHLDPLPIPTTDFHPLDYLRDVGNVEIDIREAKPSEVNCWKPKCTFILYAHFATAELNLIASGTVKQAIKQLQRDKGDKQITAGRRIFCQSKIEDQNLDTVCLNHIVTIEDVEYVMWIKIVDTGALHGIASYGDIAKAVGHELKFKDNFNSEEKGRMLDMVVERAKDFEEYALGDLDVYEILKKFNEQWQLVYEKLGLSDYYRVPKLTIGGTVKDLFEAALANYFKLPAKNWVKDLKLIIDNFIQPGSADELRKWGNFTRAILSKVEGGRCRNNRPIELTVKSKINSKDEYENPIADIDISGCYGEGQRNQDYPIGIPEIFDYKQSENNDYISLRDWLGSYDVNVEALIKSVENNDSQAWNNQANWGELLSGLWQARVSNKESLKYSQDFFASWFLESSHGVNMLSKALSQMKCDTEMVSTESVSFDEDMGNLKVFNQDIKNGVLTHDGLQWILAVASKRQRNELLNNLTIISSAVYCASDKIDCTDGSEGLKILSEKYENWTGRNTTQRIKNKDGKTSIMMNFTECHTWFSVNLGELLVDSLLIERKKAQIIDGKKSPLDVLFKLCVNTLYGDMVSKFFVTSNPVVGNNITARARALAWYMEKGLHGHQPITDGCAFELSGVLFSKNITVNGECVNLHRSDSKLSQKNIKRDCLQSDNITCVWIDGKPQLIIDGVKIKDSLQWLDSKAMEHLQNIFLLVDVLHKPSESLAVDKESLKIIRKPRIGQFSFETKDIYHSGCFHGSANYLLQNPNEQVIKARGYETKREHIGIELDPEQDTIKFLKSSRYGSKNNPAKDMLRQLLENPESIQRQIPAIKSGILKVGDYKNLSDKYDEIKLEPGDNILKPVLMQEFSLSQFTFQTYEQYISWKKVIEKAKDKNKQSLEGYFLNEDLTLNLQSLCEWVDEAIANGVMNPFDELKNPHRNDTRTEKTVKAQSTKTQTKGAKLKRVITINHPHLETLAALKEQLSHPPD